MESYLLDAPSRMCIPIVAHAIGMSLSSWPSHMYCFVPYTVCIYIYIHIILDGTMSEYVSLKFRVGNFAVYIYIYIYIYICTKFTLHTYMGQI